MVSVYIKTNFNAKKVFKPLRNGHGRRMWKKDEPLIIRREEEEWKWGRRRLEIDYGYWIIKWRDRFNSRMTWSSIFVWNLSCNLACSVFRSRVNVSKYSDFRGGNFGYWVGFVSSWVYLDFFYPNPNPTRTQNELRNCDTNPTW